MTENSNRPARIALITGGNRGLGRAEALALAADGVDIVFTYRSHAEEATAVVGEIEALGHRAVALPLDMAKPETFDEFTSTLRATLADGWGRDRFDVLVNNAGYVVPTPLGRIDLDTVRGLLDVHVTAVVMLTQALEPLLVDGGRVINTSTGLTRFVGNPPLSVYAAAKGAVEVWTRYLAHALGPRRIAVNVVAPGATATDFGGGAMRDDEQVRARLAGVIAMGHVGYPEDIGTAVAALASERMGWVTGQRVEAAGGQML